MRQGQGQNVRAVKRTRAALILATLHVLILTIFMESGCARRIDLSAAELRRIEGTDKDLKLLRVFAGQKLISLYYEENVNVSYEVGRRKVVERGAFRPKKMIVGRNIVGKVVARTEQNGMPALWVAFEKGCEDTACAYGFVLTELDRYQMFQVPFRQGFQSPFNYRRNTFKRNKLMKIKRKSLAEANDVFAVTRRSGKVLTIDLQIVKDTFRPTRADIERAGGVD